MVKQDNTLWLVLGGVALSALATYLGWMWWWVLTSVVCTLSGLCFFSLRNHQEALQNMRDTLEAHNPLTRVFGLILQTGLSLLAGAWYYPVAMFLVWGCLWYILYWRDKRG